jgi:hypothetical protein
MFSTWLQEETIPNTVKVAVRIRRAVIVDDDVHSFNINTTPEDIRRD